MQKEGKGLQQVPMFNQLLFFGAVTASSGSTLRSDSLT